MDATNDKELLDQLRGGDEKQADKAMDRLFRTYYPMLMRFVLRRLSNPADADDVVADVFVDLWKQRGRAFEGRSSLKTYLCAMARYKGYERNDKRDEQAKWFEDTGDDLPEQVSSADPVVDRVLYGAEGKAAIAECLKLLSEEAQQWWFLAVVERWTETELAETFDIGQEAAKSRMQRVKTRLESCVERARKSIFEDGPGSAGAAP